MPKDPKRIEHKFFPFETKSVDLENSEFTGFGAAIGNEDLGGDIIEPGAFKKTISERVESRAVKFLDNHLRGSTRAVWGTVAGAKEVPVDVVGDNAPTHKLFTEFDVSKAEPQAQIALRKIKEGHLDQLSIGFEPVKVEFEKDENSDFDDPRTAWIMGQGRRRIKEIKLWEVSIVIWAMNPEATVIQNSLKSLTQFAERVNQKGIDVPEDSVKQAVLALNSLLGHDAQSREQQEAVKRALDEVSDAVDHVCSVTQKGRFDPIRDLLETYHEEQGEWNKTAFGIWISDRAEAELDNMTKNGDDCGCDTNCGCKEKDNESLEDSPDAEAKDVEEEAPEEEVEDKDVDSDSEEKDAEEEETDEEVKPVTNKEVMEVLNQLSETVNSLKEAMPGAEETPSDESEDQDAEAKDADEDAETHTDDEQEKEAAKDTDDEIEDSRSEHFPDDAAIAAELEALKVMKMKH